MNKTMERKPPLILSVLIFPFKVLWSILKLLGPAMYIIGPILLILGGIGLIIFFIAWGVESSHQGQERQSKMEQDERDTLVLLQKKGAQRQEDDFKQSLDSIIAQVNLYAPDASPDEVLSQSNIIYGSPTSFRWNITGTVSNYCIAAGQDEVYKNDPQSISYYDSQSKSTHLGIERQGLCANQPPLDLTRGY